MENTQAILEVPKKKKQAKVSALKLKNTRLRQQKIVKESQLFQWLKNYWQTGLTLAVMSEFIQDLKSLAMNTSNNKLFKTTMALSKIMKEYIMKHSSGVDLAMVSYDRFEEWALSDGLSTTFSNVQEMDVVPDLEEIYFSSFSRTVKKSAEKDRDQPGPSSSSRSITHTSTSFMTVPTDPPHADADQLNELRNTVEMLEEQLTKKTKTPKKSLAKKRYIEPVVASTSAKVAASEESNDTEEEEEEEAPKRKKKVSFRRKSTSDTENESDQEQGAGFNSLLDDIVRAHSSTKGTSRISQSICVQDSDECITLKSPGVYGKYVMKFDIYPYKSCARNSKQDWWRYAEMRSVMVISRKDSPVAVLMNKMKKAVIEQISQCKDLETERKSVGSKGGWKRSFAET
ncbi:uncharacterized protein LOC126369980 [Pectinophora gossypiella]|uniref:uncharacterized protein LOC126369980 n=1 Tax=Pectinophora gossypiella TaxID=13191 RepID=UPI00214E8D88|nr:uncharacterized protein LOC126369980 [Pectinophora gossypiella]